ncbi:SDR family NAD(P)-dependent oxidoreductase [Streptomyces sp. NPDC102394]|uniref:SDR family NAD(P)-dependent oxidoreductase n=1 Tax=Streptomyces sp. NPDC102394 TaxID=3366167 RepID=UPI00380143FB
MSNVVNAGSPASRVARASSNVCNLTEFGLNGFTEALRQEFVGEYVRVVVVEPGTVQTERVEHLGDAAPRQISGEPMRTEDLADAIGHVVIRERRVAVNEMLVRAGDQTW